MTKCNRAVTGALMSVPLLLSSGRVSHAEIHCSRAVAHALEMLGGS